MFETNEIIDRLPRHLLDLIIDQPYNSYSPQDHAVWRYVMRRNVAYLSKVAHCRYVDGLAKTGVNVERIPEMYGMNRILKEIGWAAVTVDGFIPPGAFMEFQAFKVLVIAADIRPVDQIEYTPAPDIIHEAAGHAPIIADPRYAEYLRLFGEIGSKAFSSRQDYALYEAIRHLSILKADPYTPFEEIKGAEEELSRCEREMGPPSEMALIRNLHWWTVEYGLIGTLENPKIYGAGLLSSIGESYSCLQPEVVKLPYSIAAKDYSFDITNRQPQLFVTPSFQTLSDVLNEFAETMAVRRGGLEGVLKAIDSGAFATLVYDSGLQVSGIFNDVIRIEDQPIYIRTTGPTQLAHGNTQLEGHSKDYHSHGFGSPVGLLQGGIALQSMDDAALRENGLEIGPPVQLRFESGVELSGKLLGSMRKDGKLVLLSFEECSVLYGDQVLFDPTWGVYDMAIGASIISAYSGLADPDAYGMHYPVPKEKTHKIEHDEQSLVLHSLYAKVRDLRENVLDANELRKVFSQLKSDFPADWLLPLEIYELAFSWKDSLTDLAESSLRHLHQIAGVNDHLSGLIYNGLELIGVE
jgi:phenylalanine-4-hydroxylase